jgi:hypothetical protein
MGNNFSIYINMSTVLEKAFYQNRKLDMNYGPSRRTRIRCKHGTTGTCYLAQKLDLITGSILTLPEDDKIKYFGTNDEDKILNSYLFFFATFINYQKPFINQSYSIKTSEYITDFLEKQDDWNEEKIYDFIVSIKKMYQILTGQFDGGHYQKALPLKSNDINENDIKELFQESMDIPIALAFGKRGHGIYDIDHWFTLFKGKIHGTFGNDPEFVIDYYSIETSPTDFFKFLNAMKEDTPENREFIKKYIKKIWLDPQHFRNKKHYDETSRRKEKEYSINKIDKYIHDTPRLIYQQNYNIFEMKGTHMFDNNTGNSLRKIIEVFLKTGLYKEFKGYSSFLDINSSSLNKSKSKTRKISRNQDINRSRSRSRSRSRNRSRSRGGKNKTKKYKNLKK